MTGNHYATREQLQNSAGKRRYLDVELPTSQHKLCVQSLTALEFQKWNSAIVRIGRDGKPTSNVNRIMDAGRRLIVLCLVDRPNGSRLYADDEHTLLEVWDNADVEWLAKVCARHCGIDEDLEGLVKNSEQIASVAQHTE